MLKTSLLLLLLHGSALAAPIPPSPSAGINNSATPQNAQFNVGTGTVRGLFTADRITVRLLQADNFLAASFSGDGSGLTALNAANLATGIVPLARLSGAYSGITGVGTIGSGSWAGSVIGTEFGGTGQNWSAMPAGSFPYFTGTGILGVAAPGPASYLLQSTGSGLAWTGSPAITGANITGLLPSRLIPGSLPADVVVSHVSISTIPANKIIGDIAGKSSGVLGQIPLTQLAPGVLDWNILATSVAPTGVPPGMYGGNSNYIELGIGADGRISTAAYGNMIIPTDQIASGVLPGGVIVPIGNLAAGTLPTTVPASSITPTGVSPGVYGWSTEAVQITVREDGRISDIKGFHIPGISTFTAIIDQDNGWIAPQTYFDSVTIHDDLFAEQFFGDGSNLTGISSSQVGGLSAWMNKVDITTTALSASTASIRADLTTVDNDLSNEVSDRITADNLLGGATNQLRVDFSASTGTLLGYINSTGSALTDEINNRLASEVLIGGATNQLRVDFSASTGTLLGYINSTGSALTNEINDRLASEVLIGGATNQLRIDFSASTGTLLGYINSTGSALTNEINNRLASEVLIGGATNQLRVDFSASTGTLLGYINSTGSALTSEINDRLASEVLIGGATNQLRVDFAASTGTLLGYINSTGSALTNEINNRLASEVLIGGATNQLRIDLGTETQDRIAADNLKVNIASAGIANGFATLDGAAKIPIAQLPSAVMTYWGAWDAATNNPYLVDGSLTADNGDTYRVSVQGSTNTGHGVILFYVGDFIIYNGSIWERAPAADGVTMVNGKTGAVTLYTDDVTELGPTPTNKWFTVERATAALKTQTDAIAQSTTTLYQQLNSTGSALTLEIARASAAENDLYQSKLSTAGGEMSGPLVQRSTIDVQGQDANGYSIKLSSSIDLGGCVKYADGSQQCKAVNRLGHTISTSVTGIVYDYPDRTKLIFDGNQFVAIDSPTLNGTVIQNPSVCQSVAREVPSGLVDGVNDRFYLAREPKLGSEYVFVNGVQQNSGYDYTIYLTTITFSALSIPQTNWFVNVNYCYPTSEPDLNWSPPYGISGTQIQDSSITPLQLEEALKRPIQSTAGGSHRRITSMEYDPSSGEIRITYED